MMKVDPAVVGDSIAVAGDLIAAEEDPPRVQQKKDLHAVRRTQRRGRRTAVAALKVTRLRSTVRLSIRPMILEQ